MDKMKGLRIRANKYFVGGVNSPVRAFNYVGGESLIMDKGKGSKIYDQNGNVYIDYVLSFGAIMLGHAHPGVVRDTQKILKKGAGFGTTTHVEIELAALLRESISGLGKIRFVNSGTEALMSAVRLARGYTSRDKIIKFADSYHGHADCFLAKSGSGLATLNIPISKGVPADFIKHTIVSKNGDKENIDRIFRKHGDEIAAVVIEPAGGNHGVIPPDKAFLKHLRKITRKYRTLLIFDEIITGFRFSYGTLGDALGISPDLICLGKIIGGGLPVGAYGGSEKIMNNLAPAGDVYQASTFAGNPIVMQAGLTTLKNISRTKRKYKISADMTEDLVKAAQEKAFENGVDLKVSHYGTMFSFKFGDKNRFKKFFWKLISGGIYIAPSEYEANFISFAHTDKDIGRTKKMIERALS